MSLAKDTQPIIPLSPSPRILDWDEPESHEPELESSQHLFQLIALIQCLRWWWRDRRPDYFIGGNLSIYYEPAQIEGKAKRCVGPDFFVVLKCDPRPRRSWVVWKEGDRFPNVIVELLSDSTARTDRKAKKQLYQDRFKTPEYFWFDPHTFEFQGFRWVDGVYQPIPTTSQGLRWSEQLGLFLGVQNGQLRFFTPDGDLVPLPEELVQMEEHRRSVAEQQIQEMERQNHALRERLRQLGVNPDV